MSFSVVAGSLASAVADAGTFTVGYPSGKDAGDFYGAHGHKLTLSVSGYGGDVYSYPTDFDVTLGASNITITNKSGTTWAADLQYRVQLEEPGDRQYRADAPNSKELVASTVKGSTVLISLGAPIAIDADGVSVSAAITAAAGATIGGAFASGGVATFDKPRNVVITSAGNDSTKVFTVTGTDVYGNTMVENITGANAGAASGKKAFKTITSVDVDVDTAGAVTIGNGDVLGLPVFLPKTGLVLKELQDGAAATAGTLVAGALTAGGATATSGDVRGTYDPNAACNGSRVFQLVAFLPDAGYIGEPQYAG